MRKLCAAAILVCTAACGATSSAPCTQADANAIDAWYQREIAEKCAAIGRDTSNCEAMLEIEAEYDRRYDEWVRCGGER